MSLIIEIRAGEGGSDSKDLVNIQFDIYRKYANRNSIDIEIITVRNGIIVFKASGKSVLKLFSKESGVIRWQRIPPTEKKGRVHTSTITVAVLPEPEQTEQKLFSKDDIEIKTARGSGAGGQHRNVTDSAVQIKHLPTGIIVRCESGRSQYHNKENALAVLGARLKAISEHKEYIIRRDNRREQVGSGGRGEDKIRTIRVQAGEVIDHLNNRTMSYKTYSRGQLEDLNK
jgi:peptide chain release factor 1